GHRRREIGLRLALGARNSQLLLLVLRRGLAVACIGAALGLAGSFAALPLLRKYYSKIPLDPATVILVTVFLIAISVVATYIPARRALKVDPVVTLRQG